jgi:hypothetical protein
MAVALSHLRSIVYMTIHITVITNRQMRVTKRILKIKSKPKIHTQIQLQRHLGLETLIYIKILQKTLLEFLMVLEI